MDSSRSTEDDTIRDQFEGGYVATRPRGTRARDTWKVNVRNLVAEDKRALDQFMKVTAARGANAFLFPNLVPNGSFELPAADVFDLVWGWNSSSAPPQFTVATSANSFSDGAQALAVSTAAGEAIAAGDIETASVDASTAIPCAPGDIYLFAASLNIAPGTVPANCSLTASAVFTYLDSFGAELSQAAWNVVPMGAGWKSYSNPFLTPAGAATFRVSLRVSLNNASGAAVALDGSTSVLWDAVGVGMLFPAQLYGRTAGSEALPRPVRFTKLPEFSDIGIADGVKRYGVNFEVTEV